MSSLTVAALVSTAVGVAADHELLLGAGFIVLAVVLFVKGVGSL